MLIFFKGVFCGKSPKINDGILKRSGYIIFCTVGYTKVQIAFAFLQSKNMCSFVSIVPLQVLHATFIPLNLCPPLNLVLT